jgi:hypothetical protein
MEFKMAFVQPIVDLRIDSVWVRRRCYAEPMAGPFPVLSQVTDEIRYRFDRAARVMAIETARKLFEGRDLKLSRL